jgi:integrase
MKNSKFVVSRFKNRNGTPAWRVDGRLHGIRIRKNFPTREEAAAEKAALELKSLQVTNGMRGAMTTLSDDQLRQAETVYQKLDGLPHTLGFCLEYTLANYRAPDRQKSLADAVADYRATKALEHERTLLSVRTIHAIKYELRALTARFPSGPVSQFTPALIVPYLERGKPSLKTYNNRRGLLSTFFKYACQNEWIASNPVEKTRYFRINHRRGSAVTLTAGKVAELMAFVETFNGGELVPYFAICAFAGIRPCIRYGEISKLQPGSVRLDTGTIHIEPEVSKVRMKRLVTIQPNLAAWLKAYPLERFTIVPPDSTNNRRIIFAKFGLTHDVLRHTFISMFVAKFRSMGEAALQAGNSESIIRKHYLDLKSKEEAEAFFGILPKHARSLHIGKIIPFVPKVANSAERVANPTQVDCGVGV